MTDLERNAQRTHSILVALFILPGVLLLGWAFYSANLVDPKDGIYSCKPEGIPAIGNFYAATVENGKLVGMKYTGMGERDVGQVRMGSNSDDAFTATINGKLAHRQVRVQSLASTELRPV